MAYTPDTGRFGSPHHTSPTRGPQGTADSSDLLTPVDRSQMARHRAQAGGAHRTGTPAANGRMPGNPADPDSTVYMTRPDAAPARASQASTAPAGATTQQVRPPVSAQRTQAAYAHTAARRAPLPHPDQDDDRIPSGTGAYDFGAQDASDKPRRPHGSHRALKIGLGVAAGVLVAAYAGGVVAFSNLYYPGTVIAGVDVSLANAATAAARIEDSVSDYSLHISGDGLDYTYTPAAGTFSVDGNAEAQAVLAANEPLAWPVRLVAALTGTGQAANAGADAAQDGASGVAVTYDQAALEQELGAAIDQFNEGRPGTFDAAGAYDEAAGSFTVSKARASQRLDRDAIIAAANDAVSRAQTELALDGSLYEPFANGATDEQLQAACDAANEIIGVNVTLKYGDTAIATLDGATMTQWITFDDNLTPTLNSDALTAWIRNLAQTQLDTAGTERTYTRADGKQITVSGGTYGWISDEAALAEQIQQAVATKQTGDIQIPTKQTGDVYRGKGQRDWGAYVDIDLTEQHVRYYDANDNLVWESGCITGNPNKGNETPTGIYMLNSNSGGATLVGADANGDGEPDYRTPVNYWMPFVGGAVGLHDADWQAASSFSDPTAYLRTGSHGCVNLPPDKAAELSGLLEVGVCIITHN